MRTIQTSMAQESTLVSPQACQLSRSLLSQVIRLRDHLDEITAELSRRGLIRPLTTWGHLSELQPHLLTYDALTTVGGSGSPILNAQGGVIGINQAVLAGFAGSNFGIPSRFAKDLMGLG